MKRSAFHKLSYGLYLVASEAGGTKAGYIANTVFQVTSDPPQIAIACHNDNFSTAVIRRSGRFSVSVLKKELDVKLIGDFGFRSGRDFDKFSGLETITAATGAPIVLNEAVAWFDCRVTVELHLGSHWLIVGEVQDGDLLTDDDPLTYAWYRQNYKMFSPKNSPTFIDQQLLEAEKPTDQPAAEPASDPGEGNEPKPHICLICGYVYDPEVGDPAMGIPPGTPFDELPDDYKCPICNAGKSYFREI